MVADESNIRSVIQLSEQVPVILEFHATDANSLKAKLEPLVRKLDGKLVLVRIDGQKQAALAQAFKVERVPTVMALVKGQPVPLFEGDIDADAAHQYLTKLLEVAATNGLNGFVAVGEGKVGNPVLEAAYEAIAAGDLAGAKTIYEKAIAENPRDLELSAGLAQVNLMLRTIELPGSVLEDPTTTVSVRADMLAVLGNFDQAFELLLAEFAKTKDNLIKAQLLELFEVAGHTAPEVVHARKLLTNLLY
jgi:putative thioredoxin